VPFRCCGLAGAHLRPQTISRLTAEHLQYQEERVVLRLEASPRSPGQGSLKTRHLSACCRPFLATGFLHGCCI